MEKKKLKKDKVLEKDFYCLELEGEITVLHLNTSQNKNTCTPSQLVVNCDNGDLKNYTSEVVIITADVTKKILDLIGYSSLKFKKKFVK